jgi:adenylate cyclase
VSVDLAAFLAELRRRRVWRVAALYGVVAFVVAQVADIAFPALHLPDWTLTLVIALLILGLPIALVLAWAFDITPGGVRRTPPREDAVPGQTAAAATDVPRGAWPAQRIAAVGGSLVLALAAAAFVLFSEPWAGGTIGEDDADRSIAVLPFANRSDDDADEHFSDGITEDIIAHLSHIADLKVISRTSVMRYKRSDQRLRDIAAELDVTTVLEGSVRREGSRVRVTAQLIDARTDRSLWSEQYDRELTGIFEIQSEIARQIANALETRFSPEQHAQLASRPTAELGAYDHYLKARELGRGPTREDVERAIALFREAIALDPGFALAYAEMSVAFSALEGSHGAGAHWLDTATVAARRAIALDGTLAEGYSALALAQWNRGEMEEAKETYGRALRIRPNDPGSLWGMSFIHTLSGERVEGLRLVRRAVELDPASPWITALLGRSHWGIGDFAGAERWYLRTLQLAPDDVWANEDLSWMYIWQGELEKAAAQLRRALALLPGVPHFLGMTGRLALHRGDLAAARTAFDELLEKHPDWSSLPLSEAGFVALRLGDRARADTLWQERPLDPAQGVGALRERGRIAAARGETDAALAWLEQAYDEGWHGFPMLDLAKDPLLASLVGNPRFETLRVRILGDLERMRREVGL